MRWVVALVVVVTSAVAIADPAKPWAVGVSEQDQTTALALYREGNAEFEESRYAQALAKYRDAIKHWDHPMIRFNMSVAHVNLDQPLEAYEDLEVALKFGPEPLGSDGFAQAQTYKKLLDGRLTHLRVASDIDGAEVTLDGKSILSGRGEVTRLLMPGEHQIVASKQGLATETTSLILVPGKETVHHVKLGRIATRLVRRWSSRSPWIVVGAGVASGLVGGAVELASRSDYHSYDALVISKCPSGCDETTPPEDRPSTSLRTRGKIENIGGIAFLSLGGAGIVAGFIGVYLNVPRPVAEHAPVVTPHVGPDGASATLTWSW